MKFPAPVAGLMLILSMGLFACNKGKFKTNPSLEITGYKEKTVTRTGSLIINLRFTDKQGDLPNGAFVYIPIRLNARPLPPLIPNYDSVKLVVPTFPDNSDGTFQLNLPWINIHKSDIENDTIKMRFVVVDRAGNKSDTVNSDQLVILKN